MGSILRPYWSMHTHSKFSANDALPSVEAMVERASDLGYPALGLTDHGTVSGNIALYKACRKFGIEPLPGIELYVVPDAESAKRGDSMHLTMVAFNLAGYRNLMHIATLTSKNFYYKPIIDFADFAALSHDGNLNGLAVGTGCYFGVIPQVLMRRGHKEAVKVAETLAGWFPRVYLELQNHGIDEHHSDLDVTDDELIAGVFDVASSAGLPVVVTRDSHYVDEADKPLHEALKRLVSFSEDVDDATFPGGGYFMTDEQGMRKFFEPKYMEAGLEGLSDLASKACLRIPEMDHFALRIPDVTLGQDPQVVLEQLSMAALVEKGLDKNKAYVNQLSDEFDTFHKQGMAPYPLLVKEVCDFMREKSISFHTRGSATGCLVLWLLGVTQLDPIKFGLRFDRFLSHVRMKPPDVDLDIEHTRRDEVVAFLNSKWSVCGIGSHMKYSLMEDEEEESGRGSLKVRYFSTMKKRGTPVNIWRDVPRSDRDELVKLSDLKLISGYGTHAAGYIVAPDASTISQLPMAWIASSKKLVTAYGKKDVELLGFLKLDLLGLRTRTSIRITEELTGVPFESIPLNDRATFKSISAGNNMGVFQLEGWTMNHGCKQTKPRKIEDVIAAQALFRPATMHSSATEDYRERKLDPKKVPQRHSDIMTTTKETFGVMLYQEQVMDVMQALGMTPGELEEMLDAVKASNEYSVGAAVVIEEKMPRIRELAEGRGWRLDDVAWLVESLGAYAEYSFNKAHAASYGVISYCTAYMKVHYPTEFWTGVLTAYTNHKKEAIYVPAARKDQVSVLAPRINKSAATYQMEGRSIRRGYLSVKGVGIVAATELAAKGPYTSLADLGMRVLPRKVSGARALALGKVAPDDCGGVVGALAEAHVLDELITQARMADTGVRHNATRSQATRPTTQGGRRTRTA
jgi:DNA polymerase III subunit alpha